MATDYKAMNTDLLAGMKELAGASGPVYKAFGQFHHAATSDGALSGKIKELMALVVSVHTGCEGCIVFHTGAAMKKGATREELVEALGVTMMMGGGPASIYAAKALDCFDQLSEG